MLLIATEKKSKLLEILAHLISYDIGDGNTTLFVPISSLVLRLTDFFLFISI